MKLIFYTLAASRSTYTSGLHWTSCTQAKKKITHLGFCHEKCEVSFWMLTKISLLRWQMSHETYCQKYRAQNIVPLNILSSWNVPQKVWTLNQSVHLSTKHHSSNAKSFLQNLPMMAALMKFHNFSEPQKTIISCVWRHKSTTITSTTSLHKALGYWLYGENFVVIFHFLYILA